MILNGIQTSKNDDDDDDDDDDIYEWLSEGTWPVVWWEM